MRRNCSLFPDEPHLCDVIERVRKAVGSVSLIGCIFILAVIWLFKKYQIFTQRLILCLSLAALLNSASYLMPGYVPDGTLCEFQAWWLSFFDWAVLLWACCITFNLYQNAVKGVRTERYEILYHVVSWGLSFLVACLPFIGDHYGPAGVWCWIDRNSAHSQIWRFLTWYIPLWILLAIMLATYIYIIVKLRREVSRWEGTYRAQDERQKEMLRKDIKLLRAYPVVYMALSIIPSVHRIQNAFENKAVFWLILLHSICSPLQGTVNALVFAFDRETLGLLTWSSVKDALFQRTHMTTHLISEYTFTQTTGSGSSSATSSDNSASTSKESMNREPSNAPANVGNVPGNKSLSEEESPKISESFDSVRERTTLGGNSFA